MRKILACALVVIAFLALVPGVWAQEPQGMPALEGSPESESWVPRIVLQHNFDFFWYGRQNRLMILGYHATLIKIGHIELGAGAGFGGEWPNGFFDHTSISLRGREGAGGIFVTAPISYRLSHEDEYPRLRFNLAPNYDVTSKSLGLMFGFSARPW